MPIKSETHQTRSLTGDVGTLTRLGRREPLPYPDVFQVDLSLGTSLRQHLLLGSLEARSLPFL